MTEDALFDAAATAARAGELDEAASLFARLVTENPSSERGWLGLGFCCSDPQKREYCFHRVLAINPKNQQAKHGLEIIETSGISKGQSSKPEAHPFEQADSTEVRIGHTPIVAPFITNTGSTPEKSIEDPFSTTINEKGEATPISPVLSPKKPELEQTIPQRQGKKKTRSLVVAALFIIPAILCGAGLTISYYSGLAVRWLPLNFSPVAQSSSISPSPATLVITPSPTITPTVSASPTLVPQTATPTISPTAKPSIVYLPVFSKGICGFTPTGEMDVTCGYVTVPEDRTNSHSKNIKLAVTIFHSKNASPAPDPVIFLQGGPGGEAVRLVASNFDLLVKPFLSERDFIAFDQRGTGLSKPALGCEELEKVYKEDIGGQIPASSREMVYTNAFRSCHGAMTIGGIDLNAYTTLASSDDLRDITISLGYKQVDLYAVSYGTRLALVIMRDHPELVRSAILDSVVPVDARLFNDDPIRYDSALQAMFDGCNTNPDCNKAYPDLKSVFWGLVDQLDKNPVKVTAPLLVGSNTENVDGADLLGITLGLLKSTKMIPFVPGIIYRIKNGDYSTFVAVQSSLPYEFEGINIGLYVSMMCHEQILATTPQDLQNAMDSLHNPGRYSRLPFFGDASSIFKTCKVWGAYPPSASENSFSSSDIPALVIEGKYDPVTPPIYATKLISKLSHSFYMEFPNQGHTPSAGDTSGCAFSTILAFIENPKEIPDMKCLSAIKGVDFTIP
jgi:pimeloyl-ACP methyl ester carboxylesterase